MKEEKPKKCAASETAKTFAAREVGCQLEHCECGTHDVEEDHHVCPRHIDDVFGEGDHQDH